MFSQSKNKSVGTEKLDHTVIGRRGPRRGQCCLFIEHGRRRGISYRSIAIAISVALALAVTRKITIAFRQLSSRRGEVVRGRQ
jgi:hypothetical protein